MQTCVPEEVALPPASPVTEEVALPPGTREPEEVALPPGTPEPEDATLPPGTLPTGNIENNSKTATDDAASLDHLEKQTAVQSAPEPQGPQRKPFIIKIPGGEDWVFTGYLSTPSFMAAYEKLMSTPPAVQGQNTTDGRKGKKRRAKKAAKALRNQQQSENSDPTSTSKGDASEGQYDASEH